VQALTELLGNFIWVAIGLVAAAFFAWQSAKSIRAASLGKTDARPAAPAEPFDDEPREA
jgi:hypothetical protein